MQNNLSEPVIESETVAKSSLSVMSDSDYLLPFETCNPENGTDFNESLELLYANPGITDSEGFNKQNTRIIAATREEANAYGRLVERSQFPKILMVWGGICWNGKTPLVIFEPGENVNAKNYKEKVLLLLKYYDQSS
ncbi:hypothetical protein Ddc_24276 [Ditylenchus destructor]|nr:hypothetical protein Ddc_24276 [Ditylenchus destructor]